MYAGELAVPAAVARGGQPGGTSPFDDGVEPDQFVFRSIALFGGLVYRRPIPPAPALGYAGGVRPGQSWEVMGLEAAVPWRDA